MDDARVERQRRVQPKEVPYGYQLVKSYPVSDTQSILTGGYHSEAARKRYSYRSQESMERYEPLREPLTRSEQQMRDIDVQVHDSMRQLSKIAFAFLK